MLDEGWLLRVVVSLWPSMWYAARAFADPALGHALPSMWYVARAFADRLLLPLLLPIVVVVVTMSSRLHAC